MAESAKPMAREESVPDLKTYVAQKKDVKCVVLLGASVSICVGIGKLEAIPEMHCFYYYMETTLKGISLITLTRFQHES